MADAIARRITAPLGPGDEVPTEPVAVAVALADKLDTLAGFFAVGEKPTGSGDPFALRRAALGIIRIIRENGLRLRLADAREPSGFAQAVGITPRAEFGTAVAHEQLSAAGSAEVARIRHGRDLAAGCSTSSPTA